MFSTLSLLRNARFLNLTSKNVLAARLMGFNPTESALTLQCQLKESCLDTPWMQLLCEVVIEGGLLLAQRHIFLLKPLLVSLCSATFSSFWISFSFSVAFALLWKKDAAAFCQALSNFRDRFYDKV